MFRSSDWFFAFNRIACTVWLNRTSIILIVRFLKINNTKFGMENSITFGHLWCVGYYVNECFSCTVNVFLLCSIRRYTRNKMVAHIRLRMPYGSIWLSFFFYLLDWSIREDLIINTVKLRRNLRSFAVYGTERNDAEGNLCRGTS